MLTGDIIQDFKDRLRITHNSEDLHIDRLINASYAYIKRRCGEFLLDGNETGRELVLERARYAYNGQLEYFDETFELMIIGFGFDLQTEGVVDETTL